MSYEVSFYKPTYLKNIESINSGNYEDILNSAVENLEKRVKDITSINNIITTKGASSAIHLSLCALDLKRGDKVICSINSYSDTPSAVRHFDSEPIFTDIEPKSYHMSIESLKSVVKKHNSKKLRAIIVSHFAGLKQDISEIKELAKDNNLILIEDFSEIPISKDSVKVEGDIAIFSLNYRHDASLKGAVLVFNDDKTFSRAKLVSQQGVQSSSKDIDYLYDILEIGCDYRLDTLSAYLLDGLLEDRVNLIAKKREIAEIYFKELSGLNHVSLPIKSAEHQYTYFILEIDKNRDAFARELKSRGIEVGLHYIPLNFTTYYKQKYELKVFSFPNALQMYQSVMSIPCNGKMTKDDALKVANAIKEVDSFHI